MKTRRFALVHLANGRLAVRDHDRDCLLAVPPMHSDLPRDARVKVFEYVLRRQIGMAAQIAETGRGSSDPRVRDRDLVGLDSLLAERPHATARIHGLAA